MATTLKDCYFDGMTIEQAVDFISRTCGETPTAKQIEKVKKSLASCGLKEWK